MTQKIAIIEDDPAIREMYRIKFTANGYEVDVAENGKVGLELIEKARPDIVLLDMMMPEMNGDEMLEIVREHDWGKNIKVIILTNVSGDDIPQRVKDLEIDGYIIKADTTPKQVVEKVKKL